MLFGLVVIADVAAFASMGFGVFLVVRGYFQGENTDWDLAGYRVAKVPVGVGVFVAGLAAFVGLAWIYSKGVEAENDRLTAEIKKTNSELDQTKKDRDAKDAALATSAQALMAAQQSIAELNARFAGAEAERREAQAFASETLIATDRESFSPAQRAELDRYRQGVDALNKDLNVLRVRVAAWPRLDGRKTLATLEIYRRDFDVDSTLPRGAGLFEFKTESFALENEAPPGLTELLAANIGKLICDAALTAISTNVSPQQAFSRIPGLSKYEGDASRVLEAADLKYALMRLQLLAADSLVLVRGYADGEDGPWTKPLDPSLRHVQAHESIAPNTRLIDYAMTFKPDLSQVDLGRPELNFSVYGNADLPDLRGEATARIVSTLVESCSLPPNLNPGNIGVEMLDGRVYDGKSTRDRKARVYLLVTLKE